MSKEEIYDSQINPLMAEILRLSKEHKIAFIADFELGDGLHCTSAQLNDEFEPSETQIAAFEILKPKRSYAVAETISTLPDGRKKVTISRIS